ncbi:unnamed protein product, partial [marine sediment metagenome]
GKRVVTGRASSTDIIEASVKAYLNGINKLAGRRAGDTDSKKKKAGRSR